MTHGVVAFEMLPEDVYMPIAQLIFPLTSDISYNKVFSLFDAS